MNITAILSALMGMHALAGVAWLGVSLHAAFGQTPPISKRTRKAQGVLAIFVFFFGFVLWRYLHTGAFGLRETLLAIGVLMSVTAAGLQHGAGGKLGRQLAAVDPADSATRDALVKKLLFFEKAAAFELVAVLLLMLVSRTV